MKSKSEPVNKLRKTACVYLLLIVSLALYRMNVLCICCSTLQIFKGIFKFSHISIAWKANWKHFPFNKLILKTNCFLTITRNLKKLVINVLYATMAANKSIVYLTHSILPIEYAKQYTEIETNL